MILSMLPLILAMGGPAVAPPQQAPPPPPPVAVQKPAPAPRKLYNEAAEAKAVIATAVAHVAEDGIRILINWGANDDEACAKFPLATRDAAVSPKFMDEYELVYIDVGHADKNLDVAKAYGVTIAAGALPQFTVLDDHGKVLGQSSGKALSSDTDPSAFDPKKLAAFLTQHQAPPPPDPQPMLTAALAQARRQDKEVFLWFSAPW